MSICSSSFCPLELPVLFGAGVSVVWGGGGVLHCLLTQCLPAELRLLPVGLSADPPQLLTLFVLLTRRKLEELHRSCPGIHSEYYPDAPTPKLMLLHVYYYYYYWSRAAVIRLNYW